MCVVGHRWRRGGRKSRSGANLVFQGSDAYNVFRCDGDGLVGVVGIEHKGHTPRMAHYVRDGDVVLPVRAKFRPVCGDQVLVRDKAPVNEHGHGDGFHVLPARKDALQGLSVIVSRCQIILALAIVIVVLGFRHSFRSIAVQVDNLVTLFVHNQLSSQFQPPRKVLFKRRSHSVVLGKADDGPTGSKGSVVHDRCYLSGHRFLRVGGKIGRRHQAAPGGSTTAMPSMELEQSQGSSGEKHFNFNFATDIDRSSTQN
mmetsp:Transcript_39147/g.39580  ORF Transcript_39147/g.39580 Transcript_39147/m.39580 type:complete len:256 (+) Transcript_39147:1283-2050(+)